MVYYDYGKLLSYLILIKGRHIFITQLYLVLNYNMYHPRYKYDS